MGHNRLHACWLLQVPSEVFHGVRRALVQSVPHLGSELCEVRVRVLWETHVTHPCGQARTPGNICGQVLVVYLLSCYPWPSTDTSRSLSNTKCRSG